MISMSDVVAWFSVSHDKLPSIIAPIISAMSMRCAKKPCEQCHRLEAPAYGVSACLGWYTINPHVRLTGRVASMSSRNLFVISSSGI